MIVGNCFDRICPCIVNGDSDLSVGLINPDTVENRVSVPKRQEENVPSASIMRVSSVGQVDTLVSIESVDTAACVEPRRTHRGSLIVPNGNSLVIHFSQVTDDCVPQQLAASAVSSASQFIFENLRPTLAEQRASILSRSSYLIDSDKDTLEHSYTHKHGVKGVTLYESDQSGDESQ